MNETNETPNTFSAQRMSNSGAPEIVFRFAGDTVRAELAGAMLYGEAEGDDRTRLRLTAADGEALADVTVHPRADRNATENVMDVGSALLWSHWRHAQGGQPSRHQGDVRTFLITTLRAGLHLGGSPVLLTRIEDHDDISTTLHLIVGPDRCEVRITPAATIARRRDQ